MASADADEQRRFSLRAFFTFDQLCRSGMSFDRAAHLIFGDQAIDVLDALLINHIDSSPTGAPSAHV